tara:strand:+ start:4002 stop:4313 length:312 start_codon:yes stop_codon:yes gene_type:complete
MAHYAFLDENNIVTGVITGKDEGDGGVDWEKYYGNRRNQTCKRTSYNTYGNQHYAEGTAFRGNFARPSYTYDETNDVFIAPKPVEEGKTFTLDETKWIWVEDE